MLFFTYTEIFLWKKKAINKHNFFIKFKSLQIKEHQEQIQFHPEFLKGGSYQETARSVIVSVTV